MKFFYLIISKLCVIAMPFVLVFNTLSIDLSFFDDTEIIYYFYNREKYSARGEVELKAKTNGEYDLFWGDEEGKKLTFDVGCADAVYSEFTSIDVRDGEGKGKIGTFVAIPDGAKTVLTYKGCALKDVYSLPECKITEKSSADYSFGVLSDIHFNRYAMRRSDGSSITDDAFLSYNNSLEFLNKCNVSMVALAGDISDKSERDAFEKFDYFAGKYDFPIYSCTGNHDVRPELDKNDWLEFMNRGVYSEEKRAGVKEVSGFDFVYAPEEFGGDAFIFLSQFAWDYYNTDSRILSDSQLVWLEKQLETYKNRRVYLFFHSFMANDNGDIKTGEGNIVNPAGTYYDLVFVKGARDEMKMRELLQKYKNVIFFNGHSHFSFEMEKYNPILNITSYGGKYATMVHIPSVSAPRTVGDRDTEFKNKQLRSSQGYYAAVYNDRIILTGVEFLKGKMLSYACFAINK